MYADVYANSRKKSERAKESRHKLKIITFHVFITINFAAVVKLQSEKYEIKIFHSFLLPWCAMMYNGFVIFYPLRCNVLHIHLFTWHTLRLPHIPPRAIFSPLPSKFISPKRKLVCATKVAVRTAKKT
jgi:hypothetical protein